MLFVLQCVLSIVSELFFDKYSKYLLSSFPMGVFILVTFQSVSFNCIGVYTSFCVNKSHFLWDCLYCVYQMHTQTRFMSKNRTNPTIMYKMFYNHIQPAEFQHLSVLFDLGHETYQTKDTEKQNNVIIEV